MSKRGLPASVQMRHDYHYVEELTKTNRPIGKIIPIDQIEPNPEQPRNEFGDLTELTDSIREKGVLEPLLVRPTKNGKWMIIAGERRWRASNLAGLDEVPCIELDIDDNAVAEIALIENLQRKDLTIWEEADGLKALAHKFGYTQDQIAKKISKSRTTVTELMTIAGLPDAIRLKCGNAGIASKSTLLEVARQFDEPEMFAFVDRLSTGGITAREEIRKAARPERVAVTHSNNDRKVQVVKDSFVFKQDGIDLRISFPGAESIDRKLVLTALKTAFDAVKSGTVEI